MTQNQYTVVQHSAFAFKGDTQFRAGLESRHLSTKAEVTTVEKAGGILFDNYGQAEDFAESAMYPAGAIGIVPQAKGTFSTRRLDGQAIYIPVRETTVVG